MPGYVFAFNGAQLDPNGRANVPDVDTHNRAVEAKELEAWFAAPDHWCAYDTGAPTLSTWLGTPIARIVSRRTWRNALTGSRMTYIRAKGTNGATYGGSFGSDWSQLVRLHKLRPSTQETDNA